MGLDATVYCDCYETGRLRESPPNPHLISVAPDGSLDCRSDDLDTLLEFDRWLLERACEHENGVLLHHRIGNLAQVALLRSELNREAGKFPVVLGKVIYSGTHGGDYLTLNDVRLLEGELKQMDGFVCSDKANQEYVEWFRQQMKELAEAALTVGKPISF
jgi:hypothetical protein